MESRDVTETAAAAAAMASSKNDQQLTRRQRKSTSGGLGDPTFSDTNCRLPLFREMYF